MKKFKNTMKQFLLLPFLLVLGCQDLDEVNVNTNGPTSDLITPNLLLPGIERDFINAYLDEAWVIGNTVMQYTAKTVTTNIDRYTWGERSLIWDITYDNLRDINIILDRPDISANYKGIALVLRAWMLSLVTDCYGDAPFSQAVKGKQGVVFPKYDTQEVIYQQLLSDLQQANILLTNTINVSGDIIYNGDVVKWRKLANSLRLRLLLRKSGREDVSAQMAEILNKPAENPVFENINDNATYTYLDKAPDQFPLTNRNLANFNEWRASKTLLDTLVAHNDPRLTTYYRPTPATEKTPDIADDVFVGIPNGMSDGLASQYNGGPEFQSRVNSLYYENAITTKGRQVAKGVIMTYSELQFVLAEAAERGIITGNAETYYNNAIQASFAFYGITPPANFFTQNKIKLQGSQQERLRRILTQKWVSLFFQGFESWFDWRRTGEPNIVPGVENQNDNIIPIRFAYPVLEQSLNKSSLDEAISRQGADNLNTRVWWDIN